MKKKTYHKKKEDKMSKSRNRIKKMQSFQSQDRKIEPISEEHKYMIALMRQQNELVGFGDNENISRITRGDTRPRHF
jgi:hypothetical protein|tara:strand:+ start:592 stop:822 length:231 start_codon:yes stop_codon:yes gene_type:complete